MIGIYLSGTGNTKYCIEKLVRLLDNNAEIIPLENKNVVEKIKENDFIILGYPTQYSNMPYMMRDFINKNNKIWAGKRVFCVATMGAFSGDGAGCSARLIKKYGGIVVGGLHIKMPDSVCDSKLLKKSIEKNREIVLKANEKIERVSKQIKEGNFTKEGIGFIPHIVGLFGQRLWFYNKTTGYKGKLKISDKCKGCGLCVKLCPMGNIEIREGKANGGKWCTLCYRCVSSCPEKAITILGDSVVEQSRIEKYI